jgi:hypothetical protein
VEDGDQRPGKNSKLEVDKLQNSVIPQYIRHQGSGK